MKPIKVGIIANEFFDAAINRVGGFGWAGRRAIAAFQGDPTFAPPVYFSGEQLGPQEELVVDGTRILLPHEPWHRDVVTAWRERIDVLLCIDYRSSYLHWFKTLPRTPVIVWVRDPRTPTDMIRLHSLRVPGQAGPPGGIAEVDFHSLRRFMEHTRMLGRKVTLANKMAYMRTKNPGTFGLPPSDWVLPNPDVVDYEAVRVAKAERPLILSLGRLDPVKRPWLFVKLARRFPEVDFKMLGQRFVAGAGGWQPEDIPPNLQLLGNVTGAKKWELLSQAWLLVNTSIHEESAVSMLEALAYEVPLVSYIESDELSARFGTCLGYDTGTGLDSMPRLVEAVRSLLEDHPRRLALGQAGRRWVRAEHTTVRFLAAFRAIAASLNVQLPTSNIQRPSSQVQPLRAGSRLI
jgi:glycosyltransferase involved in cell wall biosynthesis